MGIFAALPGLCQISVSVAKMQHVVYLQFWKYDQAAADRTARLALVVK
jgi:hypothetical protein